MLQSDPLIITPDRPGGAGAYYSTDGGATPLSALSNNGEDVSGGTLADYYVDQITENFWFTSYYDQSLYGPNQNGPWTVVPSMPAAISGPAGHVTGFLRRANGPWLATYLWQGNEGWMTQTAYAVSTDQGASWTSYRTPTFTSGTGPQHYGWNVVICEDNAGNLWATGSAQDNPANPGEWHTYLWMSSDGGVTWSKQRDILGPNNGVNAPLFAVVYGRRDWPHFFWMIYQVYPPTADVILSVDGITDVHMPSWVGTIPVYTNYNPAPSAENPGTFRSWIAYLPDSETWLIIVPGGDSTAVQGFVSESTDKNGTSWGPLEWTHAPNDSAGIPIAVGAGLGILPWIQYVGGNHVMLRRTAPDVFEAIDPPPLVDTSFATCVDIYAGASIFWGVDSLAVVNQAFFSAVAFHAGTPPAFWGRYIGEKGTLKEGEVNFLHNNKCKILVIFADTGTGPLRSKPQGIRHAKAAIEAAQKLNIPSGVWIYADTEFPDQSPTADWFAGWFGTLQHSPYGAGVYGNTSTGAVPKFGKAFCDAYPHFPNPAMAYIYTNQPQRGCDFSDRNFNPTILQCNPPTVIQQYVLKCTIPNTSFVVDLDLANTGGFASMW